jgi:hypothetical protein
MMIKHRLCSRKDDCFASFAGPALSPELDRLSIGGGTGIEREEITCSDKILQNHGSSTPCSGALRRSASSSNIEHMVVRRGMASPARTLAAGLGLARSSSFHCKPSRRRKSINNDRPVMLSSIPLSSQAQTLTMSSGQSCSNLEETSSPMFAIKPGHLRVLTSSGSRRGSEFGSSQGSLFSLLEDGDEHPSPRGNAWVQEAGTVPPLSKWPNRCGIAHAHTHTYNTTHACVWSCPDASSSTPASFTRSRPLNSMLFSLPQVPTTKGSGSFSYPCGIER